eukprot:SAG11_NODE_1635_length_4539_cov_2.188514_6_plen_66_part_00
MNAGREYVAIDYWLGGEAVGPHHWLDFSERLLLVRRPSRSHVTMCRTIAGICWEPSVKAELKSTD